MAHPQRGICGSFFVLRLFVFIFQCIFKVYSRARSDALKFKITNASQQLPLESTSLNSLLNNVSQTLIFQINSCAI